MYIHEVRTIGEVSTTQHMEYCTEFFANRTYLRNNEVTVEL